MRGLDPRVLLFGPIFQKDMRVAGRKPGLYVGRALFALALAAAVSIAFAGVWQSTRGAQSPSARIQALQGVAPSIVAAVLWVQFGSLLLLSPMLTAGAICDERRAQTLPALLTTPLTPLQIVCAKLASRLAQLVIIALIALPVLLAVRLFGGVRAETVIAGVALSISVALMGAGVGLWFSVRAARAATAALAAYCLIALIGAGLPLLMLAFNAIAEDRFPGARLSDVLGAWAPDWSLRIPWPAILVSSPPAALGAVVIASDQGLTIQGLPVRTLWVASSLWALLIALFSVSMASLSLRRVMRRSLGAPRLTRRQRRRLRRAPAEAEQSEPVPISARRSRRVGSDPVLWRELRQSLFPSRSMLIASLLGVGVIAAVMYLAMDRDEEALAFVPVIIGMILLLLQAALLSSSGFTSERESRTLDTLLTTRLTPAQIVAGKLLGSIRRQWFIPLVLLAHMGVIVAYGESHPIVLLHLAIIFLGPIVMLSGTGVYLSLRFRKSVTATALNLALALLLWLVGPILVGILFGALEIGGREFGELVANITLFTHPVAQSVITIEGAHGEFGERLSRLDYDVIDADMHALGWTVYTSASAGVQIAVGLAAAARAVFRFEKYTGRAP